MCRRGEFYYNMFLAASDEHYLYSQADVDSYPESLEFITWLCDVDNTSKSYLRAFEVRELAPRVGR